VPPSILGAVGPKAALAENILPGVGWSVAMQKGGQIDAITPFPSQQLRAGL